ncbi:pentatricopeptide repeat-containing protein At2g33680-like [Malania oleifera]|uniref:pentatricopeptide repeat-containing protein At2g33680-like n=1 Tax=Malania oleifera TaxID=397392 RepID=UPI0025AE701D|nr:pentatricopeptide repeat-containing protein At2g33680-like [Malania oleifera]
MKKIIPIHTLLRHHLYPQALQASSFLPDPNVADSIYCLFVKRGLALDAFLAASIIHTLSHSGDFDRARKFLVDTHVPDTVAWNALISGYARVGRAAPVFELFSGLRRSGLKPDAFTLSSLIKVCEDFRENEVAHGISLKTGFFSSAFLASGFVENYAKCGDIRSAEKCFRECLLADSVVWMSMISGYVWNGEFGKGREAFAEMRCLGLELNEFCLTGVLGALLDVREGELIHGLSVKMGLLCGCSIHLNNAVMNMYSRCGGKEYAAKVFDEIPDPDVVSWTARIGAASNGVEALEFFKLVRSKDVEINELTLINVLSAIVGPKLLEPGRQIQALCHKFGYLSVVSVCNSLIFMYGKCRQMADASCMFNEMDFYDSVSWNSLIAGYAENGLIGPALSVFIQMRKILVQPTIYTLASILEVVSNSNSRNLAMEIHSHIIKSGFMSDDSVVCCLMTAYGKCNGMNESKRVFSEIDKINVVHLNAMEAALVSVGSYDDAVKLFHDTWKLDIEVDSLTFSTALKACGALTDLEHGREVHSLALKCGLDQDKFVESSAIDFYCKCGILHDAEKVFSNISTDNLAAWNAMMMGYAQHGCYHDVYELFHDMASLEIEPDEITYLAVLSSCCHAGLVPEAHFHLHSMFELYGLIPCLEHYACIVDLLGRVGLLENAKRTIDQMPVSPDAQIWQILLSACTAHRNVDLGETAARELLKLQPENDSAYILLSNLYASVGMWTAVEKLRREMKEKNIRKKPGSSWIQIKGATHYFHADDTMHPESKEHQESPPCMNSIQSGFLDQFTGISWSFGIKNSE